MQFRNSVIAILLATLLLPLSATAQASTGEWSDNKYSMFIHFGLYSTLGGVWDGSQVTRGYSEQIQSHAGIPCDVYETVADDFDPVFFDADRIVELAKKAGMRSIVITSKHHDGFCLWHTETTDFNSFDRTPSHRDFIGELSNACRKGGLNFGLYFSLIDWNYPGGSNITTHNANFISGDHHRLNLAQVEELVTGYGSISELWFDMGSLTPDQSRDLYNLVHKYQPGCMVGGRLGNGFYDFAVMGDNFYPEASLQTPWQVAASMFDETWGYRSWQQRGSSHDKAQEKLRSLIQVVANGGNYLLNIGPEGDGSVVPFEEEVLTEIGSWLEKNGNAIYATSPSPYRTHFSWGHVTRRSNIMYLILSGTRPSSGEIELPVKDLKVVSTEGPASSAKCRKGMLTVKLTDAAYKGSIKVVRIVFNGAVRPDESPVLNERTASSSYYCQDYYTNARSETSYTWNTYSKKNLAGVCFTYTATDVDKNVEVDIDGHYYTYVLHKQGGKSVSKGTLSERDRRVCVTDKGSFDAPRTMTFSKDVVPDKDRNAGWSSVMLYHQTLDLKPFQTVYVMETVNSSCDQEAIVEVGAGNGVELYVNGVSVMKHLNPYRCTFRMEKVRVNLKTGDNQIVLRAYNRFERSMEWLLRVSPDQNIYRQPLYMPEFQNGKYHTVTIRQAETESEHKDCELYNLQLIY